jgi:hypothetical protein
MSCFLFPDFVARELIKYILLQVMRAAGLGVIVDVGPGSTFEVGDRVTGSWGASIFCFLILRL